MSDKTTKVKLEDTSAIPIDPATEGTLQDILTAIGEATNPDALGKDVAGADSYTTLVTASEAKSHIAISLQGTNDGIVSVDGGTTDSYYIPAQSVHVFDGVLIASGATIQGKNATGGSNYANLTVTIW